MYVDDLDIVVNKLSESARRVIDRALEDTRRREHPLLTSAHLLLAVAQAEWDLFAQAMRDANVSPNAVLRSLDEYLRRVPSVATGEVRVCPTTKLVCKLALQGAARAGHPAVDAGDLLLALFEQTRGVPASILRHHGADTETLVSRLEARSRELELRNERLKKRFELPQYLKQAASYRSNGTT